MIFYNLLPTIFQLTLILSTILLLIILYFKYKYTFWLRHNVPYIQPTFPYGNFKKFFTGKRNIAECSYELHKEIKSKGHKFGGAYFLQTPIFIPVDPNVLKHILSTDFEIFGERGMNFDAQLDPLLGSHLFTLPLKPWKKLRNKLTPTFSSGKIKNMFALIKNVGDELNAICQINTKPIDINDLSVRYTIDIIGNVAFGIDCNTLKNPGDKFQQVAERVINPPMINGIKWFISLLGPDFTKLIKTSVMEKNIIQFFLSLVKQTMNYREANNVRRNDFFQLLLDLKDRDERFNDAIGVKMTNEMIAAQCFTFFAAGFETSSMTVNLCMFELAQNQQIQDRLRTEIRNVLKANGGELTYEALNDMQYLECVLQETLRKYPTLAFLNRICTKDYKIPDTDIIIKKGTKVLVSLLGYHMDPEFYPNPEFFDPERFTRANKENIIPFSYIPFGDGQRICIGARFGRIQTKVCLVSLLKDFKFTLNHETKLPIEYQAASFVLSLKNKIYLDVEKI